MSNHRNELLAIQELQKLGLDFSKPMREAFYLGQKVNRDALKNMESSSQIIDSFEALGKAIEYTVLENKGKISIINRYEELGKALGVENSL